MASPACCLRRNTPMHGNAAFGIIRVREHCKHGTIISRIRAIIHADSPAIKGQTLFRFGENAFRGEGHTGTGATGPPGLANMPSGLEYRRARLLDRLSPMCIPETPVHLLTLWVPYAIHVVFPVLHRDVLDMPVEEQVVRAVIVPVCGGAIKVYSREIGGVK